MGFKFKTPPWYLDGGERSREMEFFLEEIYKISNEKENISILDVGFAGSGYIDNILEFGNIKYTGLDGSEGRVLGDELHIPDNAPKGLFSRSLWREHLEKIDYIIVDIIDYNSKNKYDIVMSISVIEHIVSMSYHNAGYNYKFDIERDIKAVEQMKKLVNLDGYLILTFPCGIETLVAPEKYEGWEGRWVKHKRKHIVYDKKRINKCIGNWELVNEGYWTDDYNTSGKMRKCTKEEALKHEYRSTTKGPGALCGIIIKNNG